MAEASFLQAHERCDEGAWNGFCVLMWEQFQIRLPGGELMTREQIEKFRAVARTLLDEDVELVRQARVALESRAAEIRTLSRRTGRPQPGVVTVEMKQMVEDECAMIVQACETIATNVPSYVQVLARRKGEQ